MPQKEIANGEVSNWAFDAYNPMNIGCMQADIEACRDLFQNFFKCNEYQNTVDKAHIENDPLQGDMIGVAYLERQWLFAITYAEANYEYDRSADILTDELYKTLVALTFQSRLFYNYCAPGTGAACRIGQDDLLKMDLQNDYQIRLFDVIDSGFCDDFPRDCHTNLSNDNDYFRDIMTWRFTSSDPHIDGATYNRIYMLSKLRKPLKVMPPQWHMKSWNEIKPFLGIDQNEQSADLTKLKPALKVAVACKIALQGVMGGSAGKGLQQWFIPCDTTANYMQTRYLHPHDSKPTEENKHPVMDFTPPKPHVTPEVPDKEPRKDEGQEYLKFNNGGGGLKIGNHWYIRFRLICPSLFAPHR